jgi:hypothetical protein
MPQYYTGSFLGSEDEQIIGRGRSQQERVAIRSFGLLLCSHCVDMCQLPRPWRQQDQVLTKCSPKFESTLSIYSIACLPLPLPPPPPLLFIPDDSILPLTF